MTSFFVSKHAKIVLMQMKIQNPPQVFGQYDNMPAAVGVNGERSIDFLGKELRVQKKTFNSTNR